MHQSAKYMYIHPRPHQAKQSHVELRDTRSNYKRTGKVNKRLLHDQKYKNKTSNEEFSTVREREKEREEREREREKEKRERSRERKREKEREREYHS